MSEMVNVPVLVPLAVGLKVTEMKHFAPATRVVPQAWVSAKSPLTLMPLIVNVPAPVLLRVTVCAPLVVPVVWLPNVRLAGVRLATGAVPLAATRTVNKEERVTIRTKL